jgi:hypothetical protein
VEIFLLSVLLAQMYQRAILFYSSTEEGHPASYYSLDDHDSQLDIIRHNEPIHSSTTIVVSQQLQLQKLLEVLIVIVVLGIVGFILLQSRPITHTSTPSQQKT